MILWITVVLWSATGLLLARRARRKLRERCELEEVDELLEDMTTTFRERDVLEEIRWWRRLNRRTTAQLTALYARAMTTTRKTVSLPDK